MRNSSKENKNVFAKTSNFIVRFFKYAGRKVSYALLSREYSKDENAIVITYCDTQSCVNNFGDALNPMLVASLSGKNVYSYRKVKSKVYKPVYAVIGSVLNNLAVKQCEIWGSGFISEDGFFSIKPNKVHAVRGPLTRSLVLNQGIDCPEVYGDPALILPLLYSPHIEKKYELGIIPHFVDKENEYINQMSNENITVRVIDIEKDIKSVIDEILSCQHIMSSSLHGVIVADAYQIPSLWMEVSDKVIGHGFKFRDYMLSVGKKQLKPYFLTEQSNISEIMAQFTNELIDFNSERYLASCPFLENDIEAAKKIFLEKITEGSR